jgi:hypothetical protein
MKQSFTVDAVQHIGAKMKYGGSRIIQKNRT